MPPPPRPPRRPDQRFGRVLVWALGISVLVHVLFFLLSPVFIVPGSFDDSERPLAREAFQDVGGIVPVPSEEAAEPEPEPDPIPEDPVPPTPTEPAPEGPPAAEEAPGDAEPGDAPAPGAERLRPGLRDERLRVDPRDPPPEPEATQHERYMRHLQARIDRLNDSIAGVAERERRATDWTFTDDEGRRWGISQDGIHLGGITLPPVPLRGSTQREDEARERDRQRDEIDRQAEDYERRRAREDAARETRERRDAERNDP